MGGTAAAVAADVPVGTAAAAAAVAAAADVPVGTAAAVAKGQTNAAAVFGYFLVPTAVAAAFHHFLRNRRNTTLAAAPSPAVLPKPTDSERVGIAVGRRGGNV